MINNNYVKQYPFYKTSNNPEEKTSEEYRLELLNKFTKNLDAICISKSYKTPIVIRAKTFYSNIDSDIYSQCKTILDGVNDDTLFNYETDGLIFTPSDKSVGSDVSNKLTKPRKITWNYSLKWKPAEFNTIDFLVTTLKDESKNDVINNLYQDGVSLSSQNQIKQYKTIILRVGLGK